MLQITVSSKILQILRVLMLYNFSFMICLSVEAGKKNNSCVVLAGHLDRCVSGQVAINILAACDEEKKSTSASVPSKSKSTFGRRISHIASNLPTSAASAAVKKLRKSSHQYTASPSASPKLSGKLGREDTGAVIEGCWRRWTCNPEDLRSILVNRQLDLFLVVLSSSPRQCL